MGLTQMREEEKLARDVYTTLGEKWDMNVFKNIAKSEQTHTDTIKVLIERYGIDDPVTDDTVGVFSLPAMQSAYNEFVATGNKSLVDALIVGAMIEDLDIQDLENFKRDVDNEDILIAYENLQKGSRNHLRAFIKNLERQGGGYEAKYMSAEMFTEIIEGAQERGPASK
ncbi:DUF2202 domain-containing protein [Patescibacteria group bacterium]|nr:DUF2202 domain-containing protein [Patescibacteria group bacterium]MBU1721962.1 DUF2202 domain-containing protein [Patescibacteria group bacterium]MBU1901111.1 DUF2202 domain-containing protein [Patescibacteria group bacterium]